MSTEDDEKLAKALQAHYEKQSLRRSQKMASTNRNRAPPATTPTEEMSGSDDEGDGGVRRPRGGRRRPPRVTDAGAISGSDDEGDGGVRRPRGGRRRPPRVASSDGIAAAASDSQQIHDTNNDSVLARKLAEEEKENTGTKLKERSSHHQRSTTPTMPKQEEKTPDTSSDAELARRMAEEGSRRGPRQSAPHVPSVERSSHQRSTTPQKPKQEEKAPDTSSDAELARRMAEEGSRRGPRQSAPPIAPVERSSHRRSNEALEEKKDEEKAPDTSNDAEIARRMGEAETGKRERSSHRRTTPEDHPTPSAPSVLETSKDEEIARRLASETDSKRQRRIVPVEEVKETNDIGDDEALARKLEQEEKDEELAQRLHAAESKRRRRTSYLARKKAAQRGREQDGEEAKTSNNKSGSNDPAHSSLHDAPTSSEHALPLSEHAKKGSQHSDDMGRGRSSSQNQSKSRHRSKSRDSFDGSSDDGDLLRSERRSRDPSRNKRSTHKKKSPVLDLHESSDRNLALKIDQESRDEALARTLSMREAKRISVYQVETVATTRGRNRWNCRRVMSLAIPVVVILAAVVGLAFAFSGGAGLPSALGGTQPTFGDGDPFDGTSPNDANRWQNQGKGLRLEVLNALDDRWHINFEIAIDDWDSGDPDALSLFVTNVGIEPACRDVKGKLKVCNGDYGETKWRGINQVIIQNGFIISSVAKLNEFYLNGADEAQRQYTMCHEIGHGFGLPHTDENFFNADLGNCMDYTSNPEANKSPDDTNYAFLVDLYGEYTNRRAMLRSSRSGLRDLPEEPADLHDRVDEAIRELEQGRIFSEGGFEAILLHSSEFSESTLIDLQDGFQLQVNKLLAEEPDEN